MPRKPLITKPEFSAAVDAAVEKKLQELLPQLAALAQGAAPAVAAGGTASSGDASLLEGLAVAIAKVANQGVGRDQVVDPKVLEARKDATKRMARLLIDASAERHKAEAAGDEDAAAACMPFYRLTQHVYLDEILIKPITINPQTRLAEPTEIGWPLVPSHAMIPLNDIAKKVHREFLASVGSRQVLEAETLPNGVTTVAEDLGALAITAGGHVIRGGASRMVPVDQIVTPPTGGSGQGGLKVRGRGGPAAPKLTRVLGTVAEPAMGQA